MVVGIVFDNGQRWTHCREREYFNPRARGPDSAIRRSRGNQTTLCPEGEMGPPSGEPALEAIGGRVTLRGVQICAET